MLNGVTGVDEEREAAAIVILRQRLSLSDEQGDEAECTPPHQLAIIARMRAAPGMSLAIQGPSPMARNPGGFWREPED
jgi:hypothetical protein